jgi:hypothetical protein
VSKLQENIDFYIDERTGYMVLTAHYLSQKEKCCGNKCKHCPYYPKWVKGNKILLENK